MKYTFYQQIELKSSPLIITSIIIIIISKRKLLNNINFVVMSKIKIALKYTY